MLVGVAYGTDLEKTRDVIENAVNEVSLVSAYPASMVLFDGFGDSSLNFRVLFWVDDFDVGLPAKSAVGIAISQAVTGFGVEGQGWDEAIQSQHWNSAATVAATVAQSLLDDMPIKCWRAGIAAGAAVACSATGVSPPPPPQAATNIANTHVSNSAFLIFSHSSIPCPSSGYSIPLSQ